LMQEAIYGTLLHGASKVLHQRAAGAIQQMADDLAVNSAALIGHHLEKAKSPEAFKYLMQAAVQASDRFANQEAIACYRRAEALLRGEHVDRKHEIDVALGLAEVLARLNQLEQAREALKSAREKSKSPHYRLGDIHYQTGRVLALLGDHAGAAASFDLATESLSGEPETSLSFTLSDIEREVGWVMCRQGKLAQARAHAERALKIAVKQSDRRAIASAHNLLTPVHYWAGRLSEAVTSAREALSIREQIGDIWGSASTQTNLAVIYHRLGHWEQAESLLRQAVFVRQEIGDHQGVVLSSNTLALLLLESGRFDEAMDWLEQAFSALRKGEVSPDLASQLYGNQGLLWLRMNKTDLALLNLEKCLSFADQSGNNDLEALALVYLSEAHLAGEDLVSAQRLLEESAMQAESGSPEIQAEFLRVRSLLLAAERKWQEALDANQQALALNKEIGNRFEVAHLQLEAARIYLSWRDHDSSITFDISIRFRVLDALKIFQELPAQVLIPQAEEILARITAHMQESTPEPDEGERPVILVRIGYSLPPELQDRPALVSHMQEILKTELERLGQMEGAAVTGDLANTIYIFSDRAPGSIERLALNAVNCARAALDIGIRLNRASQRRHDLAIPVLIGIVADKWEGSIHEPEEVARVVNESTAGKQSRILIDLPLKDTILLTGIAANHAQQIYDLDPLEFKVFPEPVYCLGRTRAEIVVPQALPGSTTRLVGRKAEIGALKSWIEKCKNSTNGYVFYLEARAGMGKTRLVEEALAYARPEVNCVLGKCESFRSNISYWPLINMLEQGHLPDIETGRQLKSLLALRPPDEADEALLRNVSPADLRRELFGRLKTFLLEIASNKPLLLVMEDIHCIDLSSLDMVDFLLPLTFQAPISIMLVARAEMPGPHRALISRIERVCRDTYLRISFSSLSELESTTLIQELLETSRLPDQLWPLVKPFAGHPLSLEEALRFLVERRWLWRSNGRWHVTIASERPGQRLPTTFGDLVLGRLDALNKDTLHIFQAAAVLGESFDRTVLGRIVPHPNLSRRLAELVERGWLIEPASDQPNLFHFKHTLTRETVYATMLTSKRQLIHQRAAEAIRALYPEAESEHLELLAHHFAESTLWEESLHYLLRAAEKSAAQFALSESMGYYTKAEKLLAFLPAMRPRLLPRIALGLADVHLSRGEPASAASRVSPLIDDAGPDLSHETKAAILRRLAKSRLEMGEYPAALKHYEEALAILQETLRGGQMDDYERWSIEIGIAQTYLSMRQNAQAREKVERVLEAIDQRAHAGLTAEALNILGGVAYRQNDLATSTRMVQQSLSINQSIGNRNGSASDYSNLGILAAAGQDADSARYYSTLSLEVYEELGDSRGIAITRNNLGQLERNRGNFTTAIDHLEHGARTARRSELTQVLAQILANLGPAFLCRGQTPEALSTLDEAESLCERYRFRNLLCEVLWKRADALIENNDLSGAETAALSARMLAGDLSSQDLKSEAQRTLARIYRKTNRYQLAVQEALAAWQARAGDASPTIRARFGAEYALALLANNQTDRARQILKEQVVQVSLYEAPSIVEEISSALELMKKARPSN
ncbi:MAG: tetratricopeptide repeat protein, partial [Anaerolineales bacterium]|nr:tetratricopeptide repeat protein [Anaerolineales bacterium]